MKICELKIKDAQSLTDIIEALLKNGYEVQSAAVYKEYPYSGIDYFMIAIFEKDAQ